MALMKGPSRVILVTGAASGIGRRLAESLAAAGHRLLVTDINADALEALTAHHGWESSQVAARSLDVRDAEAWQIAVAEAVDRFGRLDVLLNVAGLVQPGFIYEVGPEEIAQHLDVNARGVMLGTRAAALVMIGQGDGHIVNIASMAALAAVPGIGLYTASKFAVRGFSLAVAQELRPHGVAVSVVCPDAVQTPMLDLQIDYPQAALTFSGPRPLTVDEVVQAIIDRVLPRRPLELTIPRSRGWLAKLTSLAPELGQWVAPRLHKVGLRRQAEALRRREGNGDTR